MFYYEASNWKSFEPLLFLLNLLPPSLSIDEYKLKVFSPLLNYLALDSMEISYMDLDYQRLEQILMSLLRLPQLKRLRLSFFDHKLSCDEITESLMTYLSKLINLEDIELSFQQNEEFTSKNYSELGAILTSMKELKKIYLFFEGPGFKFLDNEINQILGLCNRKLDHLSLNFLSETLLSQNAIKHLIAYLNNAKIEKFSISISYFPAYRDFRINFGNSFNGNKFLKAINLNEKYDHSAPMEVWEKLFKTLTNIEELTISIVIFPNFSQKESDFLDLLKSFKSLPLKKLRLRTNSPLLPLLYLENIDENMRLNNLHLINRPKKLNESLMKQSNLQNLIFLKDILISLKIDGFLYGDLKKDFMKNFKYLTKLKTDAVGFEELCDNSRKRSRILLIAYNIKQTIGKKSGIYKRNKVWDEILNNFIL